MQLRATTDSNKKDSIDNEKAPGSGGGKRRKLILTAFHDCIIENGYANTTLRDIAQSAGMTASHLLYYFPGKQAILLRYFEDVSKTIVERLKRFDKESPPDQINLLADLFFAGKGITRSEIGFMLECFGVAVHDDELHDRKKKLDRYCKSFLVNLFKESLGSPGSPEDAAEIGYSLLIGLRTAAFFDERVKLNTARRLFHNELTSLAGL